MHSPIFQKHSHSQIYYLYWLLTMSETTKFLSWLNAPSLMEIGLTFLIITSFYYCCKNRRILMDDHGLMQYASQLCVWIEEVNPSFERYCQMKSLPVPSSSLMCFPGLASNCLLPLMPPLSSNPPRLSTCFSRLLLRECIQFDSGRTSSLFCCYGGSDPTIYDFMGRNLFRGRSALFSSLLCLYPFPFCEACPCLWCSNQVFCLLLIFSFESLGKILSSRTGNQQVS